MMEPSIEQLLSYTWIICDRIRKKYVSRHVRIKSQALPYQAQYSGNEKLF